MSNEPPPPDGTRSAPALDIGRRTGAPRLIDWTGERCVPWAPDPQVVYEHVHRYLWAAELVRDRDVLDLASGEGFGGAILAATASSVVGIDIDERSVAHSRLNYESERLSFRVGDARDLSEFADGQFSAVVAFEMIEHVADQLRVLEEIKRVLADGGLMIMSTPDRQAYSEATGFENPFHARELDQHEFLELLSANFAHVAAWGQRTVTGSAMAPLPRVSVPAGDAATFFVKREGDQWAVAPGLSARYVVAVASDAPLPPIASTSTLSDADVTLLRHVEAEQEAARRRIVEDYERVLAEQRAAAETYRSTLEDERRRARRALREARTEVDHKLALIAEGRHELALTQQELAGKQQQVELGQQELESIRGHVHTLELRIIETDRKLARIENSVVWNTFQSFRARAFAALGGERSRSVRAIQVLLRLLGSLPRRTSPARRSIPVVPGSTAEASVPVVPPGGEQVAQAPAPGAILFPEFEEPEVSLIIPVHRRADLTRVCLESIAGRTAGVSYEVIIVDDASDPESQAFLRTVRGARVIQNESNLGYIRSVNRAAKAARGNWIVLCNNDIEVGSGWLEAMYACARSSDDIAIVTPMYLYPDRSLNEAGAIIWRDGSGWNYGRGENPSDWCYQFRRDVDYGSAAALLVRADLFRDLGGYDERYIPMYYEDADLCMEARARGLRVVYEPTAAVVHVEGATAGTDESAGHKRHQETNRLKFVEKWRDRLEADHRSPGARNVRLASDRGQGERVLIIDHLVPLWDQDAGSLRMLGIIEALVALGYRVTFLPDDFQRRMPHTGVLQSLGVNVLYGAVDVANELSTIAGELALVICSRPHIAARWLDLIRGIAPWVPVAYDTVDLHWVRESRRARAGTGGAESVPTRRSAALRELELAMVRASDMTIVASEDERATILAEVATASVEVVPTYHPVAAPDQVPPAERRSGIVFVGSFRHPPNIDGALMLVRQVMPYVWRILPDTAVKIIGTEPPTEVQALAGPLVDVTGWVPDIEELLDSARVLLAPLTYGAGMKGKITQAMARGLPVVTTAVGAEGIPVHGEATLLRAETAEGLGDLAVAVLRDDDLWGRLSGAGLDVAEQLCSPAAFRARMAAIMRWAEGQPRDRGDSHPAEPSVVM